MNDQIQMIQFQSHFDRIFRRLALGSLINTT